MSAEFIALRKWKGKHQLIKVENIDFTGREINVDYSNPEGVGVIGGVSFDDVTLLLSQNGKYVILPI